MTGEAPAPAPEEWIFTFGMNGPYGKRFVRIQGTKDATREEMFRRYGNKWAFQYPSEEAAEVKKYNLTELK